MEKRLRELMGQSQVVLFMKGSPDTPRCGFSRKMVALLRDQNVNFAHFDIFTDESVRQGKLFLECLTAADRCANVIGRPKKAE